MNGVVIKCVFLGVVPLTVFTGCINPSGVQRLTTPSYENKMYKDILRERHDSVVQYRVKSDEQIAFTRSYQDESYRLYELIGRVDDVVNRLGVTSNRVESCFNGDIDEDLSAYHVSLIQEQMQTERKIMQLTERLKVLYGQELTFLLEKRVDVRKIDKQYTKQMFKRISNNISEYARLLHNQTVISRHVSKEEIELWLNTCLPIKRLK